MFRLETEGLSKVKKGVLCDRYIRYTFMTLFREFFFGLGKSFLRVCRGRPTVIESECVSQVSQFAFGTLPSSLMMTLLYGFGFAYFVMTRLPNTQAFIDVALPQMGSLFVVYVIPAAIANLVVIRGVVSLTSDIASMRASQELDALEVGRYHPAHFIFMPRALALLLGAPVLFVLGIFSTFLGAWLACQLTFRPGLSEFWEIFVFSITSWKASLAIFKVTITAFVMTFLGGYFGFEGPLMRAESVGKTTTSAVVTATLAITSINLLVGLLIQ